MEGVRGAFIIRLVSLLLLRGVRVERASVGKRPERADFVNGLGEAGADLVPRCNDTRRHQVRK